MRKGKPMKPVDAAGDFLDVLVTKDQINERLAELAKQIENDYQNKNVLLVGVLKGAVMLMADLSRQLSFSVEMDWMAVSSYGKGTTSSGVVRILKDLDADIANRHVLILEDIVDSGLTLSWLVQNLRARQPASLEVFALLRKPEAIQVHVDVKYVGFDIPPDFVVGYGLDYAEGYRNLDSVATLNPAVYSERP